MRGSKPQLIKPMKPSPIIKRLGIADYASSLAAMQAHNCTRAADAPDEIWLVEHPPVYTLGLAGKLEHVLDAGNIPIIKVERGGQVTYHGPGQLVVYLLLGIKNLGYGVKELVQRIEQSLIDLLAEYKVISFRKTGMPGVYVAVKNADKITDAKIAAIGLRIANHATYHGLSLNVDMDLEPFSRINPCGYEGLAVTQMRDFGLAAKMDDIAERLVLHLQHNIYSK